MDKATETKLTKPQKTAMKKLIKGPIAWTEFDGRPLRALTRLKFVVTKNEKVMLTPAGRKVAK